MVKLNILAGGSIDFIASYLFDSVEQTLTLANKNPSGPNVTWIERGVFNPTVLYAVNEVDAGAIQSFIIFDNGTLSGAISTISTNGSGPAHVFASPGGEVSAMNFGGGNGVIVPTENNGTTFGNYTYTVTFTPPAPGLVSHPHETIQPGNELFVPDLGCDTIWRLAPDRDGIFVIEGEITQPPGSGPRHAVISDNILITLHEYSSTITSQFIPSSSQNSSDLISSIYIVPTDQASLPGAKFAAAEVLIPSPNDAFPLNLVYASNRNVGTNITDPRGDSVAILSLGTDGTLQLVNQFFTGLQQVRGMQFGGPDDRYLVASGAAGNGAVVVFERTGEGEQFVQVAMNPDIQNLTSFVWI